MLSSEPETENQVPNRGEELTLEQFGEFTHSNTTQHLDKFPPADEDLQPSPSSQSPQNAPRPASRRQLYLMVMADFGLAFVWLSKFAVATPYFQHSLKAGPFLSHLVWIMGPLSGLIVAPVVGVLSDRCTSSFGRRRPFMLGGTICCIIGMNIFANASRLTFGYLPAARVLAILAFGVLDFATNAIMFPSRALLGDLLPKEQQHPVQSAAAVIASLAEISGGIFINLWDDPVTHIATIFTVASILLAVTAGISLYVCKEKPLELQPVHTDEENASDFIPPENSVANHDLQQPNTNGARDDREQDDVQIIQEPNSQNITSSNVKDASESHEHVNGEASNATTVDMNAVSTKPTPNNDPQITNEHEENDEDDDVEAQLSIRPQGEPNGATQRNNSDRDNLGSGTIQGGSVRSELVESIRTALREFPRPLISVGIVYGLAWFVWFAALPSYSQWLGGEVLGGDARAEAGTKAALQYQKGVRVFSIANAGKAFLAMGFSAYYPSIIKWVGSIGERVVFGTSFLVFSIALYATAYTKDIFVAALVIVLGSVPFIVTQTIPIAIVVQRYPENLASNLGVMNLFCVIPQLVDTLYTGKVAEIAGESAVLRIAGVWGFAAALAAFFFL